jgi:hypothetical protein
MSPRAAIEAAVKYVAEREKKFAEAHAAEARLEAQRAEAERAAALAALEAPPRITRSEPPFRGPRIRSL